MGTLTAELNRRRRRRRVARLLLLVVVPLLLVVALAGASGLLGAVSGAVTGGSGDGGAVPADASRPGVLLVNADHPVPEGLATAELVTLAGTLPVSGSSVQVASELVDPLRELFAAAAAAGHDGLYVNSGFRSAQDQQELWDAAEDRSFVQPPGHSEHQTGLAVDLADLAPDGATFGESSSGVWLAENAWRYGFVLRYPEGKEEITGIAYEAWHFRWVGPVVAEILHSEELALEEYVGAA